MWLPIVICLLLLISVIVSIKASAKDLIEANVSVSRKIGAYLIRFLHSLLHVGFFFLLIFLLYEYAVYNRLNIVVIVMVNLIFAVLILCFAIYKMCILTIWYNMLLDVDKCIPYDIPIGTKTNTITFNANTVCGENNMLRWIQGNFMKSIIIAAINAAFLLEYMAKRA